ncbi:MAG: ABC transporter ATP-binding protein [Nitrospiria bacterium]
MLKTKKRYVFKKILIDHFKGVKGPLLLAAVCMIGLTVSELLNPWPIKIIFDYILLEKPLPDHLSFLGAVFREGKMFALLSISGSILVIALLRGFFAYAQLWLTSRIGFQLVYALRVKLFAHLQGLSLSFHTRERSGELMTKVSGDTKILRELFSQSTLTLTAHILKIAGMLVVMFFMNWQLSLIVSASFPPLIYSLFYTFRNIKKTAKKQRKEESKVVSRISEILTMIPLVQSYARQEYETERFETDSAQTLKESLRIERMVAGTTRMVEIICAGGVVASIFFGSLQALKGLITPGDLLVFISYVRNMYTPLKKLPRLLSKFSKAMASADRIADLFEVEQEIKDHPKAIIIQKMKGEIKFKDVSFRYDKGSPTLNKVSFTISPGQRVALVGASGAGKSTIAKLLLRLYDIQDGEILIDNIDIKLYKREVLRREIGIVLQEAILLGTTIRENIRYGKPEATQEEVEKAARYAHADDFIRRLPHGYETIIGERGCTLSGGQRQRIGLARAIIREPSVLILDEPTSAVDAESARFIQASMRKFQKGRTALVIIHQLDGMADFDRIIALKDGLVIEEGQHQELLSRRGYYEELYRLQNPV